MQQLFRRRAEVPDEKALPKSQQERRLLITFKSLIPSNTVQNTVLYQLFRRREEVLDNSD